MEPHIITATVAFPVAMTCYKTEFVNDMRCDHKVTTTCCQTFKYADSNRTATFMKKTDVMLNHARIRPAMWTPHNPMCGRMSESDVLQCIT